jgi:Flp pilus assembly protein TadD
MLYKSLSKIGMALFMVIWCSMLLGCSLPPAERVPTVSEQVKAKELLISGAKALDDDELGVAAAAFRMSHELVPSAEAWDGLGCVALLSGDLDRAESLFFRALDADRGYYNVYGNLALLELARGSIPVAKYYFRKSLTNDKLNFRSRSNYAILRKILGEPGSLEMAEEGLSLGGNEKTRLLVKKLREMEEYD